MWPAYVVVDSLQGSFLNQLAQHLVPNTNGTEVASSEANIYSGQYSTGLLSPALMTYLFVHIISSIG